jgi:flavin-dependent thymidylate synthase
MKKTLLKAPLEAINVHFMVEGVTRSFTHQMVRQRTAVFAQESLRFSVIDDVTTKVALPPSLAGTREPTPEEIVEFGTTGDVHGMTQRQKWRIIWDAAMLSVDEAYNLLVNDGMPAEDARGLLPHAVTTRLNYHTDLRNLISHAGNRLCTQAQFEWRMVWVRLLEQMSAYCTSDTCRFNKTHERCDNWQWKEIASIFRPVCYLTGKCEFGAEFDRKCSIRSRVQANAAIGRSSSEWSEPIADPQGFGNLIEPIHPAEWLLDAGAAR